MLGSSVPVGSHPFIRRILYAGIGRWKPLRESSPAGSGLHQVFHGPEEPAGDQDPARFGLAAEAGSEVCDGADGPVVPASLEADGAFMARWGS